jgi:hypothetical protein
LPSGGALLHSNDAEGHRMNDKKLGKGMAKAAAIGAIVGIPVPFIGPVVGAAAGAGYAWYKAKKRSGTDVR